MIATRGEAGSRGGRHGRAGRARLIWLRAVVALVVLAGTLGPLPAAGHPLGDFSISHYSGLRLTRSELEVTYVVDMAEIPTFQEIQETGIIPEEGHPSLALYLAEKIETLKKGLLLEVNGLRLDLRGESKDIIFPPGAGGLPTMKLGIRYRAKLDGAALVNRLHYRDDNFPNRAGWKEIITVEGRGVTVVESSVPDKDRSLQLADYPTDLLNSPPQDLEARVIFAVEGSPRATVSVASPNSPPQEARLEGEANQRAMYRPAGEQEAKTRLNAEPGGDARTITEPLRLQANQQATPRNSFTELMATNEWGIGILLITAAVAIGLGAVHALEPGHGKTVVAAYLVGSRGTAGHAFLLGLIVTASHTAGVYLLGAVTLYASRYILPERLYPWLGVLSGVMIAALGGFLFLRRYAGEPHPHSHEYPHRHDHVHDDDLASHSHTEHDHTHSHHHQTPSAGVSARELLALGVTGGIVPCPAALVVLLSAVSLHRVGFGLLLIVAFSVGLAAVLITIGLLMVYARRLMSRFHGDGPLLTRWLPLTSSAVITVFGVSIAIQALVTSGILQIRF